MFGVKVHLVVQFLRRYIIRDVGDGVLERRLTSDGESRVVFVRLHGGMDLVDQLCVCVWGGGGGGGGERENTM